jgi:hypothetical protein
LCTVIATYIQGLSKKALQSWEIDNQEELVAFEFCMETGHRCFMTLPPDAANSPKGLSKKMLQSSETFI